MAAQDSKPRSGTETPPSGLPLAPALPRLRGVSGPAQPVKLIGGRLMPSTVGCMVDEAVVWYNPQCSKCIGPPDLLVSLFEYGEIG